MRWLSRAIDRFCYKHPRFGIPNLMKFIVFGNIIVFVLNMISRDVPVINYLYYSPHLVLQGEVWRLFTFLFVPVNSNILFFAISLYLYYFLANVLEQQWGAGKFTIFYFSGILLTVLVSTLVYLLGGPSIAIDGPHYINMSIFLAFASLFPDFQILLFFIIPVKMKWLAWLDVAFFLLAIAANLISLKFANALLPVAALFNYLVFFWGDFDRIFPFLRYKKSRAKKAKSFKQVARETRQRQGHLHKCTVCARTDTENPSLEFRYCSKCTGYRCYCADHIHNHTHIQQ